VVRKKNIRMYITMSLFDKRRYKSLVFILDKGTEILGKFRFK